MQKDEMDLSTYITNPKWEVVSSDGKLNEVFYECCPEPYQDITFTIKMRRRTISYYTNIMIPSITITFVSILSLLIPATVPMPRFLVIFLLLLLLSFRIPKDLPKSSLLSNLLGWCYFIIFSVLVHSIIVTAIANALFLKSSSLINKMFRAVVSRLPCGGMDDEITEEQVRYEFAKSFDIFSISCIFVAFIVGVGVNISSAPHFIVE